MRSAWAACGPSSTSRSAFHRYGTFRNVNGEHWQRVGNAVFGGLRKRVAVRGHQREDAQNGRRIVELRARLNIDAALVEQEIGARNGRAPPAELAIKADRRGQMLHEQHGAAIDHARVPVVGAHPVGGIGRAPGFEADRQRRCLVLRLPVEGIVVAAVTEVKETSRRGQKIEGCLGVAARALEDAAALTRPFLGFLEVKEHREPDSEAVVAQAARTFLQVRLQMKDGVTELGVAGARDLVQLLGDGGPLTQHKPGKNHLVQLLVEGKLPGQKTAVERGKREFQVVGVEFAGFFHRARAGAGPQPDVPHTLNDGPHRLPRLLLGFFVGKGEEHVDVGIWEQIFAAVAAQGQQGHVQGGQFGKGPAPHFNQDAVDHGRSPPDGGCTVSGAFAGLANQRHLPRILLPKIFDL